MELVTILIASVLFIIILVQRHRSKRHLGRRIPGPTGLPILGSSLRVNLAQIHLNFYNWAMKYGKIFRVSLFGQGIVVLNDIALMKKAFVDEEYSTNYCNHPQSVIGKYVVYNNKDIAFSLLYDRTFITLKKMFSKAIRQYSEENKEYEEIIHQEISRFIEKIREQNGSNFKVKPLIRRSFGNLMCIMLSGELPRENDSETIWEFNDSVFYIAENSVSLMLKVFPFLRHIRQIKCGRLFQKVIEQRTILEERYYYSQKEMLDDGVERGLVDKLLKLQKEENRKAGQELITEENIKSLLLDITAGGMTSTTNAITASIGLLADHPDCARRIQAEIDEFIGYDRLPSVTDKSKMPYMMAFIFETLRYISHGSIGLPHEVARDHKFEGFRMKKNDIVFTNIWFVHKDPSLWNDPWTFQPERFLDSEGMLVSPSHINRHNLITFSMGRHSCPGSDFSVGKVFLYVTSVLQVFDIAKTSSPEHKTVDPKRFLPGLFLEPEDFQLKMSPRI